MMTGFRRALTAWVSMFTLFPATKALVVPKQFPRATADGVAGAAASPSVLGRFVPPEIVALALFSAHPSSSRTGDGQWTTGFTIDLLGVSGGEPRRRAALAVVLVAP
jgi:hypothetical protein